MCYHKRHLPHYYPLEATLFLTWRLFPVLLPACANRRRRCRMQAGSLRRATICWTSRGTARSCLRDPRIAAVVADALEQGESEYRLYQRFAWVIMPNHVHVVMRPLRPLPAVMRWIKGPTAHSANLLLTRTGQPLLQYETYDHVIRNSDELKRLIRYVERNPVRAGLATTIENWPWSSAGAAQRPTPTCGANLCAHAGYRTTGFPCGVWR